MSYFFFKRICDILFSIFVLFVLSPLLLLISLIIVLQDGGSFLFKQKRIGRNGESFIFYKFRSMPVNTLNVISANKNEVKVTFFGKLLRRANLDELPQFYNVLIGDMSVIGPRPPIPSQTNLIHLRKVNKSIQLRPGLTGWAQVNSYDNMPEEKKAYFDGEYYKKMNLKLDIIIFFKTFIYFMKPPPTY